MTYQQVIENKKHLSGNFGFDPLFIPPDMKPHQKYLVDWGIRKGRAACIADCGLGKTYIQLVSAQNFAQKENKPSIILTPTAVAHQTKKEGEKFGIPVFHSKDGKFPSGTDIVVTNYEKLHMFNEGDFGAVLLDESSILKNFNGVRKGQITSFMRKVKYRQLYSATAAPNDYIELGTSSEALGEMGYMDMLAMFFGNKENSLHPTDHGTKFYLKPHATADFWRWVSSWARAMRMPSDLGFSDDGYVLPDFIEQEHVLDFGDWNEQIDRLGDKMKKDFQNGKKNALQAVQLTLMPVAATNMGDQRIESRMTIQRRCEKVAELSENHETSVLWGNLDDECDLIEELVPGAVQVSGKDKDEAKEEKFNAFADGQIKKLVTKTKIGGFGLNWQHNGHMTFFASHSYEQVYQSSRRSHRFGRVGPVYADYIASPGELSIMHNFKRKSDQADKMFKSLVEHMNNSIKINNKSVFTKQIEIPSWM